MTSHFKNLSNTLSFKLNLPLIIIGLIALVTLSFFANFEEKKKLERLIQKETQYINDTVIISSHNGITKGNLTRIASTLASRENIDRLSIINIKSHKIIADNDHSKINTKLTDIPHSFERSIFIDFINSNKKQVSISHNNKIYKFHHLYIIDSEINRLRPVIIFLIYNKYLEQNISNYELIKFIIVFSIGIAFMISVVYIIQRRILVKPLNNISQILNQQKNTSDYLPLPETNTSELDILTHQYNELTQKNINRELELIETRKYIDGITNEVPVLLSYIDKNYHFKFVNKTHERWFDIPMKSITGMEIKDLLGVDFFNKTLPYIDKVLNGEIVNFEQIIPLNDHETKAVNVTFTPDLSSGDIQGFFVCVEDISETKASNEKLERYMSDLEFQAWALEEAKNEAELAARGKSDFMATMSHEIRTPMNGVLGMAELLNATSLNVIQKDYVESILNSGNLLLTIINDILDYSKLEAGKVELEMVPVQLEHLLHEILQMMGRSLTKNIDLILDYPASIPHLFIGDPSRLRQIFFNIIGNAIKFTEHGYICVIARYEDSLLTIDIKDTGIGITEEQKKSLFESFNQADSSTTRKYGGTGLGLAITKKLIETMSGNIEIESEHGVGSTFKITLELEADRSSQQENELNDVNIMLIEDNVIDHNIISSLLSAHGAHITRISKVEDLINTLQDSYNKKIEFQLVLFSLKLSAVEDSNYGQALRNHKTFKNIPSIILSPSNIKMDESHYIDSGFSAYLTKPIRNDLLISCILTLLKSDASKTFITKHNLITPDHEIKTATEFTGHILLVEDVLTNQLIAKTMLQNIGLTVDVAEDGMQAVSKWTHNNYDLIFMDCRMPNMDGYEATKHIRTQEHSSKTPIVALTANATEEDRAECYAAGMDDIIIKPFQAEDLIKVLSKWLH